jgi:hypothetical protein
MKHDPKPAFRTCISGVPVLPDAPSVGAVVVAAAMAIVLHSAPGARLVGYGIGSGARRGFIEVAIY